MRIVAPTSGGRETSQNCCELVRSMPACGSMMTVTDHICHTAKPRNSQKTDQMRFCRAVARPGPFQNAGSSGVQLVIQRPSFISRRGSGGLWTGAVTVTERLLTVSVK